MSQQMNASSEREESIFEVALQLSAADTGGELLSVKTGIGLEAKPMFSADGRKVCLIANGLTQLPPAQNCK